MTLVGGLGTVLGPVVGAFFLTAMQHYLAQLGSWVTVVQGVIFVFCVLVFRRGIVGVIASYAAGRRKPRRHRAGSCGKVGGGPDRRRTGRTLREVAHAERSGLIALGGPSSARPWLGANLQQIDGELVGRRVAPERLGAGAGSQHGDRSSRSTGRRSAIWRLLIARRRARPGCGHSPNESWDLSRITIYDCIQHQSSRKREGKRCLGFNVVICGALSSSLSLSTRRLGRLRPPRSPPWLKKPNSTVANGDAEVALVTLKNAIRKSPAGPCHPHAGCPGVSRSSATSVRPNARRALRAT